MDLSDEDALIAFLQAQHVALTALFESHPHPEVLRERLTQAEARVVPEPEHEAYRETLDSLRKAIAPG